ncbi:MAG: hypothetical protein H6Q69_2832 [Firmicutes bacterium]|nr:hypothetical protein [Bacillota bacterium]MBP2659800.1 hypothetical protein [Bacillota bacterium]
MPRKILFLTRQPETEFYIQEQNKYDNVTSTCIFKKTGFLGKLLCKILRLKGSFLFFGDWKENISDYDLFIIRASRYSLEVSKYIRERSNKKIVQWYWNPVCADIHPDKVRGYGAEICSFDPSDCKNYNLKYITPYYFSTFKLPHNKIVNDIYFVGADKGRLNVLLDLRKTFGDQGLKVDYRITKSSKSTESGNYTYQPGIPYHQVLEEISSCRAILDYVQSGQTGLTLRPMEALFHKKKLITNDVNICEYDFYNKSNIFILGKDDLTELKSFIHSPYMEIDKRIVEKYDFKNWLKNF